MDGPRDLDETCTFVWDIGTHDERMDSSVYFFTDNDVPHIRHSGSRELTTNLRTTFDPEPPWLDGAPWKEDYTSNEVKDGLCLNTYEE